MLLAFTDPLDPASAADPGNFSVERWNYRWTANYGSPDFKLNGDAGRGYLDKVQVRQEVDILAVPPRSGVLTSCSMYLKEHYVVLNRGEGNFGLHCGAILLDLLVYDAIGVIITLLVVLSGVLNLLGWGIVLVYLFFAAGSAAGGSRRSMRSPRELYPQSSRRCGGRVMRGSAPRWRPRRSPRSEA